MKPLIKCAFVVVACLAQIVRGADPLDAWTSSNSGTQKPIRGATFGKGVFVATGATGTIITSLDGVTWTQRNSGTSNWLLGVVNGGGLFVAAGGQAPDIASTILTSKDGETWTQRDPGVTNNATLYNIAYGSGRFVAVGGANNATVVSSSDGVNWTPWYWTPQPSADNPGGFAGVAYGNGQFVALGQGDYPVAVATSPDGVSWSQHYDSGPTQVVGGGGVKALTFGNGLFVAVGGYNLMGPVNQGHATIWTSADGLNWTLQLDRTNVLAGSGIALTYVAYGGGQFVAGGNNLLDLANGKPMIFSSSNGTNWVARDLPPSGIGVVTFGNGRFVGLAGSTAVQSGVIGKLGASLSPGGGVLGTITGVTGQNYIIQSSTNLAAWILLTNVTVSANGTAQFNDPTGSGFSRRFYSGLLVH